MLTTQDRYRPATGGLLGRLHLKNRHRDVLISYLFISPWLVGFLVFLAGPMVASLYLSFTKYTVGKVPEWLGLANYERMFTDPLFYVSLQVTVKYTVFGLPLGILAALLIALLLNQKVFGIGFFRTVVYLPSVVSGVAVALVFAWIFNYRFGILNYLLSLVGISGPNWLGRAQWAIWAFVIMSLWGIGSTTVIFLAALQGVPVALQEAATIDGAGVWRRFISITLPMISPSILFVLIMGVIGSFQTFTTAYVMTGGGPANGTLFYLLYLYKNAFNWFEMGYASALAWLLFLILLVLTVLLLRSSARWVYYEVGSEKGA
jgi:multiple sugar transport system permease protein